MATAIALGLGGWAMGCGLVDGTEEEDRDERFACDPTTGADPITAEPDGPEPGAADYVLGIFSAPTGKAAVTELLPFTLTLPGATSANGGGNGTQGNALRVRRTPARGLAERDAYWAARLAFEQRRRRGLDALVNDLQQGRRTLARATARSVCGDCGASAMCWKGQCVDEVAVALRDAGSAVTCSLVDVVTDGASTLNVLVEKEAVNATTTAAARDAARKFLTTLPRQLRMLGQTGHGGALDRDADGRMTLVFVDAANPSVPDGVVGFFDYRDFLPAGDVDASGNGADLLWSRLPGSGGTSVDLAVGTLAHEYTHLVSYAQRVQARGSAALREVLWLDEGIAHLMEDLTGWGPSNIPVVEAALAAWPDGSFAGGTDTVEQRGRAYLLLRHLVDQRARGCAKNAADAAVVGAAQEVVGALIAEDKLGFEHSLFVKAGPEGLWQWLLATYTTGNAGVTFEAAHRFDYLPVAPSPQTQHAMGINPRATFTDAVGQEIILDGPAGEQIDVDMLGSEEELEGEIYRAGSFFYVIDGYDARQAQLQPAAGLGQQAVHLRRQRLR